MVGDKPEVDGEGMMTFNAETSNIRPRFLWLLRIVCRIAGADLRTWKARRRKGR